MTYGHTQRVDTPFTFRENYSGGLQVLHGCESSIIMGVVQCRFKCRAETKRRDCHRLCGEGISNVFRNLEI